MGKYWVALGRAISAFSEVGSEFLTAKHENSPGGADVLPSEICGVAAGAAGVWADSEQQPRRVSRAELVQAFESAGWVVGD
jgi:hypothetical protein